MVVGLVLLSTLRSLPTSAVVGMNPTAVDSSTVTV